MNKDRLPILSAGAQDQGSGRMCAEQAVAWLAAEDWTDRPQCVQTVLNELAIRVNDLLPDDRRGEMWPLILRQPGTAHPEMEPVLSVRLAAFLARKVLHLVDKEYREACENAIQAAERWCDCPCATHARMALYATVAANRAATSAASYAVYAANAAARATIAATSAAFNAASAAAYAAYAAYAADAGAYAASYAGAYAADAGAYAAGPAADAILQLLSDAQDEVERLTGHVPLPVDEARMESLREYADWKEGLE